MMNDKADESAEIIALKLLLEGIYQRYGFDFRGYSLVHVRRRLEHRLRLSGFKGFAEMIYPVLEDEDFFTEILSDLTVCVSEMFRDPVFFSEFRKMVVPCLRDYKELRIWHAGCAFGQEVYSTAILLEEQGLIERAQLYATDINQDVLDQAEKGVFPIGVMKEYTANYISSGGEADFSDYYTAAYDSAVIPKRIRDRILFSFHNLVTDGVFGEMHVIFCRNVLIYFGRELQERVLALFTDSLVTGGFLCLGSKESLRLTSFADSYDTVSADGKIYRKKA